MRSSISSMERLVVTLRVSPSELGVVVGENYSDRGTEIHTVVLVIIHEEFDPYTLKGDIALLRLYEDVITRVAVKTLMLISPALPLAGLTGFVTGWGRCDKTGEELCLPRSSVYFHGERLDPMLRTIKFRLLTGDPHCDAYLTGERKIDKGMLCVGPSRLDEPLCACMAVPGAPLVVNARLAGFQSWGFGCGYTSDLPIVYTNIQYYLRWINFNISILKKVTKSKLTEIFKATKAKLLFDWLVKTRKVKPTFKSFPLQDIHAANVDRLLTKLNGSLYDIRDFIDGGRYHEAKLQLYENMKLALRNEEAMKKVTPLRMLDVKPFLGTDTFAEYGMTVKNGSVYFDDSDIDSEAIDSRTRQSDDDSYNPDVISNEDRRYIKS